MDDTQRAAFIFAQSVCALAEIQGMVALNDYRKALGQQVAYDDEDFFAVPDKYPINHNAVLSLFHKNKRGEDEI